MVRLEIRAISTPLTARHVLINVRFPETWEDRFLNFVFASFCQCYQPG